MKKTTFSLDERAVAMLNLAERDFRDGCSEWQASALTRSAIVRAALDEFMVLDPHTRAEAIKTVLFRRWRPSW